MTKKDHHKIVFFITLVAGIAFLIGGFFVIPLLGPGAALLAAAAGFYNGAFTIPEVEQHVELQPMAHSEPNQVNINIDNRHITFTPMFDQLSEPSEIERPHRPINEEVHKIKSAPQLTLS